LKSQAGGVHAGTTLGVVVDTLGNGTDSVAETGGASALTRALRRIRRRDCEATEFVWVVAREVRECVGSGLNEGAKAHCGAEGEGANVITEE